MKSIIIDASLDKELLEKGFAIIPILNGEDTNSLHQFYLENHHSPSGRNVCQCAF
jgi:hypothetical protein